MSFRVVLIQPPLVHRTGDMFGNIPFMPTGVSYLAGYLRQDGLDVAIVDGFGLAPEITAAYEDGLSVTGLPLPEIVAAVGHADVIGIAVHASMSHGISLKLLGLLRAAYPGVPIVAGGHHATAIHAELLAAGFDFVVRGEGEHPFLALVRNFRDGIGGLDGPHAIQGVSFVGHEGGSGPLEANLDQFGFAAHDLLPLENYWRLGMSHAPVRGRYLAITTSRGCPYGCRFCTTPEMLGRRWRTRTPGHVVDEMEQAVRTLGVTDFIIQDEIFGVKKKNALGIAAEILKRGLQVRLYLPSGIKVECWDRQMVEALRKAGLQYISLAPESGSPRVLKNMNKPLVREKLFEVVDAARDLGIRMGAFFILGFEDETDADRAMTKALMLELIERGVDDVSLFIWSPLPGADSFTSEEGWERYEQLNWSPTWRVNYQTYSRYRTRLYLSWLFSRIRHRPAGALRSARNVWTGQYELKSEMALSRVLKAQTRPLRDARSYLRRTVGRGPPG